jgi:glycosyltransferase involved in cell wall biosynthesis
MYPRFSQTFIVNEILELEQQGADLSIGSLRKPNEGLFHESFARVKTKTDYFPETIFESGSGHWRGQWDLLREGPSRFARTLSSIALRRSIGWLEWLQAYHVVRWAAKRRLGHLHVHFGTEEATVVMLARKLGGPPYSLTLHAFDIFRDNVDHALLTEKINQSAFTVTVCESNRQFMMNTLRAVDASKIRVNYNGVDLSRFRDEQHPREPRSILTVGRLIEKKGFRYLIRAVALLRDQGFDARCTIVGDGRDKKSLEDECKQLKLNGQVRFAGSQTQDAVRDAMQRSACFVLACVQAKDGNVDALPTVLLESMGCGCPCVSTSLSGVPEILEQDVSGLLVEPGDVASLARAIRRVLEEPGLADRLAVQGRARAEERFDVTRNVATMRRWFSEQLESRADRAVDISPATEPARRVVSA